MEREWWVIDTRSNTIVNCITGNIDQAAAERHIAGMVHPETLRVTEHPTRAQLEGYRYWNERP